MGQKKRFTWIILVVVLFLSILIFKVSADTIYLKNKDIIKGEIIEETDEGVVVKIKITSGSAVLNFNNDEIERIEESYQSNKIDEVKQKKEISADTLDSSPGAYAQEFQFHFNPPDGTTLVQTCKTTKIKEMGLLGKQIDVSESKTRSTISKTDNGYSIVCTPLSITMSRNGLQIDTPILSVLQNLIVTYKLDTTGQLLSIEGYESLQDKMKELLHPSAHQKLSSVFNNKILVKKDTTEWNGRVGNFVGRRAKLGDVWISTDKFDMPNGESAIFYVATKFVESAKYKEYDCIRIQSSCNSNSSALADFAGKTVREISEAVDGSRLKFEISNVEIQGEGERIIDPKTMLWYSETINRTIKMQMEIPGQGQVMTTVQEKKEYSFDYIR